MKLADLKRLSETEARQLVESVRWPNGPVCPHCGNCDQARVGKVKANPAKRVREGLYQCKECRKQFSVTVGTVMEKSKLPMSTWVYIMASMANAKKGVSAKQLQRELKAETSPGKYGNYESMWFACHRVRHAMREEGILPKLGEVGRTVVADEGYVGGKPRFAHTYKLKDKTPVVVLVEKNGQARTKVMPTVTAKNVAQFLLDNVSLGSTLVTDESPLYTKVGRKFGAHKTVNHRAKEYVRVEGYNVVTSNLGESFLALVKRSVYGSFHSVSPEHLQKYMDELTMRWNNRKMSDVDRALLVVKMSEGKRLMYAKPKDLDIPPTK